MTSPVGEQLINLNCGGRRPERNLGTTRGNPLAYLYVRGPMLRQPCRGERPYRIARQRQARPRRKRGDIVARRLFWLIVIMALGVVGAVLNNQGRVYRGRRSGAAENEAREASRQRLFDLLRPVALSNCELE